MAKTIEVFLSDELHARLSAEATAAAMPFFKYCRHILEHAELPQITQQPPAPQIVPQATTEPDRISRIEDAVARLTDFVLQGQPAAADQQHEEPQATAPIDVDSLVDAQFHEAEAAGLTEHVPDEAEEVMRHAGVRPLSRRAIPFSSTPRHLQGL